MKNFHIAIGVKDIEQSIIEYSKRLEAQPTTVIAGEYALWRTKNLNFSIRKTNSESGQVRHLGWEDVTVDTFSAEKDINGITWERFSQSLQQQEILSLWPDAEI